MENKHDMNAAKQTLKDKLMAIILLESSKDYREMDSDLVKECVDFLMELEGKERLSKEEIEQRVDEIPFKGKVTAISSYAKRKIMAKRLAVVAAVLAAVIALFGILAIASGDKFIDFFIQMGHSMYELIENGSMNDDGITYIKPNETKTYSSIEELIKSEEIEILYPTWLPENEKIVSIVYFKEDESEAYVLQSNNPYHSIEIKIDTELSEKLKSSCIKEEIADFSIYIIEAPQYTQVNFIHKNNLYIINSDTKDNLFRIIENLKEIN